MEENSTTLGSVESSEQVDRCGECGHAWLNDEPAHYADCRFFFMANEFEEDELDLEQFGWSTFRPALL